eukprot:364932-Chlamydomonas_euryale.AAC.3
MKGAGRRYLSSRPLGLRLSPARLHDALPRAARSCASPPRILDRPQRHPPPANTADATTANQASGAARAGRRGVHLVCYITSAQASELEAAALKCVGCDEGNALRAAIKRSRRRGSALLLTCRIPQALHPRRTAVAARVCVAGAHARAERPSARRDPFRACRDKATADTVSGPTAVKRRVSAAQAEGERDGGGRAKPPRATAFEREVFLRALTRGEQVRGKAAARVSPPSGRSLEAQAREAWLRPRPKPRQACLIHCRGQPVGKDPDPSLPSARFGQPDGQSVGLHSCSRPTVNKPATNSGDSESRRGRGGRWLPGQAVLQAGPYRPLRGGCVDRSQAFGCRRHNAPGTKRLWPRQQLTPPPDGPRAATPHPSAISFD